MSLTDYKLLSEVMPGTLIESPGSIVDEVWASTSRKSSAIVIDFNYQGLDILSSPFKQMNYYNLHTLWRKAERLVHDIKVFSMRPLMLKHDFFIMIVYIGYKFDSALKSSQITILPTVQPEMPNLKMSPTQRQDMAAHSLSMLL